MCRKQVSKYSNTATMARPSSVQEVEERCDWRDVLTMANCFYDSFKWCRIYPPAVGLPWMSSMAPTFIALICSFGSFSRSDGTKITLSYIEWKKAAEIAWHWVSNPVTVELPLPLPSVGKARSPPSGGDDEGFGPDGTIVTAGETPCGRPVLYETVLILEDEISPITPEEE
jgi:hypothetical protein